MKKLKLLILILGVFVGQQVIAQTNPVFKLTKENSHFYFDTTLNGAQTKVMLESGVSALFMSNSFYEAHKDSLQLEVKDSDLKIRYLNGFYHVKYAADACLRLGDALFTGPVNILQEDIDRVIIPIQKLRHPSDSSSIVRMDLNALTLSVCKRESLCGMISGADAFDMTYNKWGMPVVATSLSIKSGKYDISMEGDFIIDMGNGSLLYLNNTREEVKKMLKGVKLQVARNLKGEYVSKGLIADQLTICNRNYKGVSVAVIDKIKSLHRSGFLGLKFFTMPVIFDFDNNKMYLLR